MNLPNKLTMLRMLMIPLFIACFYLPESWLIGTLNGVPLLLKYVLAAVVFLLAYVTDTLDGRIARARGLVTDFRQTDGSDGGQAAHLRRTHHALPI